MATNVAQVLDALDQLDALAAQAQAVPVDLSDVLEDIAAAKARQHERIGDAVFPEDAPESLVVAHQGVEYRFNRRTGRLEPVQAVSAADVPLADVATGGAIEAGEPDEQALAGARGAFGEDEDEEDEDEDDEDEA